jgi:2-polyprenyl-3-methyl-5-hydroxy-6-metoxy-1,4-benzoquinol methylase
MNMVVNNYWQESELEYLDSCPLCNQPERKKLYEGIHDRHYGCPGEWTLYRCLKCGAVYLSPRPTPDAIGKAYEIYSTHSIHEIQASPIKGLKRFAVSLRTGYLNRKYGYKQTPSFPIGYYVMYLLPPPLRWEWDHYARNLSIAHPKHNQLLDVGCGNGDFLIRAKHAGWDVCGIDFDAKALDLASNRGINAFCGTLENADIPEESFDVITMSHVIEHSHDPLGTLENCYKLLKPGGMLWIATPNPSSLLHSIYKSDWYFLAPPTHLILLDKLCLIQLLDKTGYFKIQSLRRGFIYATIKHYSDNINIYSTSQFSSKLGFGRKLMGLIHELIWILRPEADEELVIVAYKKNIASSSDLQ